MAEDNIKYYSYQLLVKQGKYTIYKNLDSVRLLVSCIIKEHLSKEGRGGMTHVHDVYA